MVLVVTEMIFGKIKIETYFQYRAPLLNFIYKFLKNK